MLKSFTSFINESDDFKQDFIKDLAQKLIKILDKPDVEIQIIGLRPGEKLYEELNMNVYKPLIKK